jgi:hypothetical protein
LLFRMKDRVSDARGRPGFGIGTEGTAGTEGTEEKPVGDDHSRSENLPHPEGDNAAGSGVPSATSPGTEGPPGWHQHVLDNLRREAAAGTKAGEHAAAELGRAAQAMALEVVPTGLRGDRALVGHVLGMHLELPAAHLHGPREAPALLYLFADAVAIRPTDDAPMSTIPLFGLHMVLPPAAIARWVYKAGRIEHANLDLVKDAQRFADTLAQWTVDDFEDADPKLDVRRTRDLSQPLHVYEHLGYAHLLVPVPDGRPVHLKSALPASSNMFLKLWQLFTIVEWPQGLTTEVPAQVHQEVHEGVSGGSGGTERGPRGSSSVAAN